MCLTYLNQLLTLRMAHKTEQRPWAGQRVVSEAGRKHVAGNPGVPGIVES